MDWSSILDALVPTAGVVLAAVFAFLWRSARKLVKETENKWDDALVDAFDQGYAEGHADGSASGDKPAA